MARTLYLDCFSGASGDMILGALLDAGLPLDELRAALGSLALDGASVSTERVLRAGVSATKFVVAERETADHADQHHHHQGHRSLAEIGQLIDRSALSVMAKDRAKELFQRLGEAEAAIHHIPVDAIHLHEVGALDSIIDIVGAVFAFEWLAVDQIICSPLNVGGGMVDSAHGRFPVPAPATVKLLVGAPVYSSGNHGELVTPTGALLVKAYAGSFGPTPPMTIERVGYGAGSRDPAGTPNVLRVLIGEGQERSTLEQIAVLECEIDDMNPQIFGPLMEQLYAAGALEVYFSSVQMKKNRPGTLLTILGRSGQRDALATIVFRETTTIGVRSHEATRERLDREIVLIETPFGTVRFKIAKRHGDVVNVAPEFEDCLRIASTLGIPLKDVQTIAAKSYLDTWQ